MSAKLLEQLWKSYPESHLHCDVTKAGQHSYRIVASLLDRDSKRIASVEHYGSGDLDSLKEEAFERLEEALKTKTDS
jgi:hypothetical protein